MMICPRYRGSYCVVQAADVTMSAQTLRHRRWRSQLVPGGKLNNPGPCLSTTQDWNYQSGESSAISMHVLITNHFLSHFCLGHWSWSIHCWLLSPLSRDSGPSTIWTLDSTSITSLRDVRAAGVVSEYHSITGYHHDTE